MSESDPLAARVFAAVGAIDAASWDALAGPGNPFISHAFLTALEDSGSVGPGTGWTPVPIGIESPDGRLLAAMPAYLKGHSQGEYVFDQSWADAWHRAGGSYYPKLQIAALKERIAAPAAEIALAYLDAYDYRPTRAEAACEFARWNRLNRRFAVARDFARIALNTKLPNDVLFIDRPVYDWRARDELAVALYWCGEREESARLCRQLLACERLPADQRKRVAKNLDFALGKA